MSDRRRVRHPGAPGLARVPAGAGATVVVVGGGIAGLSAAATELANVLAENIDGMDEDTIEWILHEIRGRLGAKAKSGPTH